MTWAEKRFPENQQKMIDTCRTLAEETGALLAPIGAVWQAVQNQHPDIELYFRDGEHASPYGDFLIAAVLCRLLTGGVSDAVSGQGFDFLQGQPIGHGLPRVIEDRDKIPTALERDKTDRILAVIRRMMV